MSAIPGYLGSVPDSNVKNTAELENEAEQWMPQYAADLDRVICSRQDDVRGLVVGLSARDAPDKIFRRSGCSCHGMRIQSSQGEI